MVFTFFLFIRKSTRIFEIVIKDRCREYRQLLDLQQSKLTQQQKDRIRVFTNNYYLHFDLVLFVLKTRFSNRN